MNNTMQSLEYEATITKNTVFIMHIAKQTRPFICAITVLYVATAESLNHTI